MDGVDFNVEEMDVVGRSKVRHVGGWTVRKILTRARNYTRKNVYTNHNSTLAKVETKQRVCQLLEEKHYSIIRSAPRNVCISKGTSSYRGKAVSPKRSTPHLR